MTDDELPRWPLPRDEVEAFLLADDEIFTDPYSVELFRQAQRKLDGLPVEQAKLDRLKAERDERGR
jgi:hypothetical protein